MLVTHSLPNSLTNQLLFSKLDACELCELLDVIATATESSEKVVDVGKKLCKLFIYLSAMACQ